MSYFLKRNILYIFLLLLVVEGLSWLGLMAIDIAMPNTEVIPVTSRIYANQTEAVKQLLASQKGETKSVLVLDPDLGWRYRENYESESQMINSQGARSSREYSSFIPEGVTRITVFGDSFAYGTEVSNSDAWSKKVEELNPTFEVLNFAVPGFGADQAYLRFRRDGKKFDSKYVVITFTPVNLQRLVNVYRRFISSGEIPLVKPRFVLNEEGDLDLLPVPYKSIEEYARLIEEPELIQMLGSRDQWYSPSVYENPLYDKSALVRLATNLGIILNRKFFSSDRLLKIDMFNRRVFNTNSTAFKIQSKIFFEFNKYVKNDGSIPIVMFFPQRDDISNALNGRPTIYSPLVDQLASRNINFLDTVQAFTELPGEIIIDQLFAPGGHYGVESNQIIAEYFIKNISKAR